MCIYIYVSHAHKYTYMHTYTRAYAQVERDHRQREEGIFVIMQWVSKDSGQTGGRWFLEKERGKREKT